jgi:hypothetical protein
MKANKKSWITGDNAKGINYLEIVVVLVGGLIYGWALLALGITLDKAIIFLNIALVACVLILLVDVRRTLLSIKRK